MDINLNDPQAVLERGLELRDQGEWLEAEAMFLRARELAPDLADAHIELACLIADHGRLDEAAVILEGVVEQHPQVERAKGSLGKVYIQLKRFDDAIRAIGEAPADPASQSLLGAAYLKKGELERARQIFETILARDENAFDARMNLATIYNRLGQNAEAARHMTWLLTNGRS